jgi:predicted nucleic acid-binding protein
LLVPNFVPTLKLASVVTRSRAALIAAIALEHRATLFTLDRDFTRIAAIVSLPLYVF